MCVPAKGFDDEHAIYMLHYSIPTDQGYLRIEVETFLGNWISQLKGCMMLNKQQIKNLSNRFFDIVFQEIVLIEILRS